MKLIDCLACLLKPDDACMYCNKDLCSSHKRLHLPFCHEDKPMGCDIHPYLEVKFKGQRWAEIGSIDPGRDYSLFGYMAGVRTSSPLGYEPKGFPTDASWEILSAYTLVVTEVNTDLGYRVEKSTAEKWVASGSSVFISKESYGGTADRVSGPDWHSASWLDAGELSKIQEGYPNITTKAIIAILKAYESEGYEARIVFWFDN